MNTDLGMIDLEIIDHLSVCSDLSGPDAVRV